MGNDTPTGMNGTIIKMASDVGEIKGKVNAIESRMQTLEGLVHQKITGVHASIGGLVTQKKCEEHMEKVERTVASKIDDVFKHAREVAEQAALSAAASAMQEEVSVPAAVNEVLEERAEKRRKMVSWYIATGIGICTLLGIIGGAFVALSKFSHRLDKIDTAISQTSTKEDMLRTELRKRPGPAVPVPQLFVVQPPDDTKGAVPEPGPGPRPKVLTKRPRPNQ